MYGVDYSEIVGDTLLKSFEKVFVVNPLKDEINKYTFKNRTVTLLEKKSLISMIEECKDDIHPDYLSEYVNTISGNFSESVNVSYKEKENSSYVNRFMYAKKIQNNEDSLVIIFLGNIDEIKFAKQESNEEEMERLISDFSEKILKIYNVIDINPDKDNPTFSYIKNQLENLTANYPKLNDDVEKNIIKEVNSSRKSLLIVDDDIMTRNILKKTFENDFNIVTAENGQVAIDILEKNYNNSSLVLNFVGIFLDITMPVLDGFAVLDYLREKGLIDKFPIIIISAAEDKETRQKVYSYNIADMLEKPFNLEIIKLRINNFIKLYKNSNVLNSLIINKDKNLDVIIDNLVNKYLLDYKDNISYLTKLVELIARKYSELYPESKLTESIIAKIVEASKYYDVGKMIIPKEKMNDFEVNKEHPKYGSLIIEKYFQNNQDNLLREYACNIALYHHENYDGSGYPNNTQMKDIPLYATFVALVGMYIKYYLEDKEKNHSLVASRIISFEGKVFSPELITTFRSVLQEFINIFEQR